MDSGVLPRVDRQILFYQRWLTDRLATIGDPERHQLLRHFAAWHHMRRLRAKATRRPAQTFLRWCMKTDRMPSLALPPQATSQNQAPLHQHRRLAILRRVLNDDSLPLRSRVVAALVLLYAQPVSRIVRRPPWRPRQTTCQVATR